MSKTQRTVTTVLWAVLVLAMVGVISAGLFRPHDSRTAGQGYAEPVSLNIDAPDFSLIDQDGQTVSKQTLKGRVWIADFIFTSCAGPCQEMTKKMDGIQDKIADKDIRFISITVDPDRDTPSVLKTYGTEAGAKAGRWSFLTGDKSMVYDTAHGMMVNVIPGTENTPLEHSKKFILVDAEGKIRSVVSSEDPELVAKMIKDAEQYAADARKAAAGK